MKRPITLFAAIVLSNIAAPAFAHHSLSLFDRKAARTVEGEVKDFQWASPHIWLFITVSNGKSGSDSMAFEGGSPYTMTHTGWSPTSLKAGEHVKVEYYPRTDGEPGGLLSEVLGSDGKKLEWRPFSFL
jgi:hypothetical protein